MSTPKAKMKTMPTGILKNEAIFNEDLIIMEALLYRGVITRAILDPAGISPDPVNGDTYFVPDGSPNSTGDWSGQGGSIAVYFDGWRFIPPDEGLTVWIVDEAQSIQFRNGVWVELSEFAPQELNQLTDVDFSGSPSPQGRDLLVFDDLTKTWIAKAPSGKVFQETVSVAGQVNADIPLTTPNAVSYEIIYRLVTDAAGDGDNIDIQVTDDDFATVESGASDYAWNDARAFQTTFTGSGNNSDSSITLTTSLGSAAGEGTWGSIMVSFPHDTGSFTDFQFKHNRLNSNGNFNSAFGGGIYAITSGINGIRLTITPTTGAPTITGEFHVFAIVAA